MRFCTIKGAVKLAGESNSLMDCIIGRVTSKYPNAQIKHCDLIGKPPVGGAAKLAKGCFSRDPQFRDPENLDYRLKPTSPCRKKASDGGDIGCRFTPEMLEMLRVARELRKKGIIKF